MRLSNLFLVVGAGLSLVAGGLWAYDWYRAQPPNIAIDIRFPEHIEAGVEYAVPIIFENHTRRRMRVVGWTHC